MQYLWTDWRPDYENRELVAHTGLYYSGGLNTVVDNNEPQARDDAYLFLLGLALVIESVAWVRRVLEMRVLRYLGERSLSKVVPLSFPDSLDCIPCDHGRFEEVY